MRTEDVNQEVVPISSEPRVNDRIRAREVRLVAPDGEQVGIKSIEEARWLADNLGLDLVEVAANARPPVVRMMDYGKYKYEQSVKAREARKKQSRTVIKEVQFRPKIGKSDFEVKRARVERFLNENDKVKVTMRFRGREVTHPEIGRDILQRLADSVEHAGVVEQMPRLDGRQMTMVIAPLKRDDRKADSDKPRKRREASPESAEASDAAAPEDAAVAEDVAGASTEPQPTEPQPTEPAPEPQNSETADPAAAASDPPVGEDANEDTEEEHNRAEAEDT